MCAGTLLWTQVFDLPLGAILRYCVSGKRRGASSLSVWRPLANLQRNSCSAARRAAPLFLPVIPRLPLEAVAEQIIPADQDPGAKQAGSVRYIDRVLAAEQRDRRPMYAAGLQGIDQTSRLLYSRDFVKVSFDEQTAVLEALEKGEAPGE